MRALIFSGLVVACVSLAQGWVSWNGWYFGSNPAIHTNNSTPSNLLPKVPEAISAWRWSGSGRYPHHAGMTGRDCGSGDSWFSDDDDGYNVVDYWNTCNGEWSINCNDATAATFPIDVSNWGGGEVLEMDIVMCSNRTWSPGYTATSSYLYQSTLTHELGHLMGLDHSNPLPIVETMYFAYSDEKYSLSADDVTGIRSIYGPCGDNDWVIEASQGHHIVKSRQNDCGVSLGLYPRGTPGDYWTTPVSLLNSRLGGWIYDDLNTFISWTEYDRQHSSILSLMVTGTDGIARELNYARNASNWWGYAGWVNMSANPSGYNSSVSISRNINTDYFAEYGVKPRFVNGVRLKHFVYMNWSQNVDNGSMITNVRIQRN